MQGLDSGAGNGCKVRVQPGGAQAPRIPYAGARRAARRRHKKRPDRLREKRRPGLDIEVTYAVVGIIPPGAHRVKHLMARPKRSGAATTEGRYLASRIQDAHRRGYTNAEIGRAYGINERTVRKIRSGETSGKRTFGRLVEPTQKAEIVPGASPSIVRVDIKLPNGQVRTVNARIPTLRDRSGKPVAPTPADVFRVPKLASLIDAEAERLVQHYGLTGAEYSAVHAHVVSFRPIALRRKPLRIEITRFAE